MPVNEALFDAHRAYEDRALGIREEFLAVALGGAPTVAVLSEPLERTQRDGWVICHSFGIERINLHRLEVLAARALAAAGFPVLRFDTPGYGDSLLRGQPVAFQRHLDAALDAVELLAARPGIDRVGVIGGRFGAMVAVLAAERAQLSLLGLWQPFMQGAAYLEAVLSTARFTRMIERGRAGQGEPGPNEDFQAKGWTDLNGFVLTREAWEDIGRIDLRQTRRFDGRALVVGVSDTGSMPTQAAAMLRQLQDWGADCSSAVVGEKGAGLFGQHQFQRLADGRGEQDALPKVFGAVIGATVDWSLGRPLVVGAGT